MVKKDVSVDGTEKEESSRPRIADAENAAIRETGKVGFDCGHCARRRAVVARPERQAVFEVRRPGVHEDDERLLHLFL